MSHPFLFNERFTDYDEKKGKKCENDVRLLSMHFRFLFLVKCCKEMSLIEMPNALFTRRKKVVYFQRVYKV